MRDSLLHVADRIQLQYFTTELPRRSTTMTWTSTPHIPKEYRIISESCEIPEAHFEKYTVTSRSRRSCNFCGNDSALPDRHEERSNDDVRASESLDHFLTPQILITSRDLLLVISRYISRWSRTLRILKRIRYLKDDLSLRAKVIFSIFYYESLSVIEVITLWFLRYSTFWYISKTTSVWIWSLKIIVRNAIRYVSIWQESDECPERDNIIQTQITILWNDSDKIIVKRIDPS